MTGRGRHGTNIPSPKASINLRGDLDTTGTIEGPNPRSGTTGIGIAGLEYEDIPPPNVQRDHPPQNWTLEKIGSISGIATAAIIVIIFFYSMNSNVNDVKADVKESKGKIERLDEKANKQASVIENVANSVQRLEGEIRRTQDYVHDRRK